MKRILILGGGFGGLIAAERLADALGKEHQITLVSTNPDFIFYPALVHLAFGETEEEDIIFDLAEKMKSLGVRFVQGEALNINTQFRRVKVTGADFNGEISYDYLIIAVGRRLATEKIGGFFEHSHHLLNIKSALKFREAIQNFKEGNIVVGLCPESRLPVPVCETAFALSRKFKTDVRGGKINIRVVFPETIEAAFGGADVHRELIEAFEKHGIEVIENFPIREISATQIISDKNERLDYDLPMLSPPFRGQTIVGNIRNASGAGIADAAAYAKVHDTMRVHNLEGIYAVGDIVAFSGPKFAHQAVGQARVAAENIISEIRGEEPNAVYYHEIATIIDEGGADSIYLHYGIWDDNLYNLKKGRFWHWTKEIHDKFWRRLHK